MFDSLADSCKLPRPFQYAKGMRQGTVTCMLSYIVALKIGENGFCRSDGAELFKTAEVKETNWQSTNGDLPP